LEERILKAFKNIVSESRISQTEEKRLSYARDLWPLSLIEFTEGDINSLPDLIIWPETIDEVSKIVSICNENRIPIIPYSGGSGVCGGTRTTNSGVVMDMKLMDKIIKLDELSHTVDVQAGCNGERFERYLNSKGFTLGHFPSSIYCSTVGGWIATRSAGQCSTRYGKIEDMVLQQKHQNQQPGPI